MNLLTILIPFNDGLTHFASFQCSGPVLPWPHLSSDNGSAKLSSSNGVNRMRMKIHETYVEIMPLFLASSPAEYDAFVSVCIGSPSSASQSRRRAWPFELDAQQ